MTTFDPITLEILWSNLIGIVSEQARALQRTAFSPIVREAGDLANALFDRRGRMVAQAVTGTPGHINSLAAAAQHFLDAYPLDDLAPGDVLITNDPWLTAGHLLDITVISPIFHGDRAIGLLGSTIHHVDVGGYGIGAGALDVFEEGLRIPITKFYHAGQLDQVVAKFIRNNVRDPDHVFGDLHAQVASNEVGARRLAALCARHNLVDIEALADAIIDRSEASTRESIRRLPAGSFVGESRFDIPTGDLITLRTTLTIDNVAGSILIDFAGSSPPSRHGINVVRNYTHAYATFAIRSCLDPDLPNNFGSLAPIHITAPQQCIVNAQPPAPVSARHVVGMFVPMPILKALAQVVPEAVLAEGAGAVWTIQTHGVNADGQPFVSTMFNYAGGAGARARKDGLSATCYPTGVAAVPIETLEAAFPIRFLRKELRPDTGGLGRQRGGLGQTVAFTVNTPTPWLLNAVASRLNTSPDGLFGGEPGAAGSLTIDGEPMTSARKVTVEPSSVVTLTLPGGGGYGPSAERDPAAIAADLAEGLVTHG